MKSGDARRQKGGEGAQDKADKAYKEVLPLLPLNIHRTHYPTLTTLYSCGSRDFADYFL